MLHKTVDDIDGQSISTKIPQSKAASFLSSSKRQMYRSKASQNNKKVEMQIYNMVEMEPQNTTCILSDKIVFLETARDFVVLSDCHYKIINDRSKPVMICRNCQPFSQLLFWQIRKPGTTLYLESMHRFATKDCPSILHFNMSKYNPSNSEYNQSRDIYIQLQVQLKPISFLTIENSKKALYICEYVTKPKSDTNQYHIILVNTSKANKIKNAKFGATKKLDEPSEKAEQKQFIYQQVGKINQKIVLKADEHVVKMINSEYGDSVLVITNYEIYQLEFEQKQIIMKKVNFLPKLSQFLNRKQYKDDIIDISYVIDGLKLVFVTQNGYIGQIEAENIQACKNLHEIIGEYKKNIQLKIKGLHMMVQKFGIQTENGAIILCKLLEQKQIQFSKLISLPKNGPQVKSYKVSILDRHDELALQRVVKTNKTVLQVLSKNLLVASGEFQKIYSATLLDQKGKTNIPIKITNSRCNKIVCVQRDNTLSFYKYNQDYSSQAEPAQQLFSKSFFQKPSYVSFDPYGTNVIVLFRQFVKFFKFEYKQLTPYFTYNIRNVCYAGFTQSGQYIIIAVDDKLYFLNPYNFQTLRVMQVYGDIKSIRFYDNILYVLLKTKVNKNTSQTLYCQMYVWNSNQYNMVRQIKVQATQALLTNNNFVILATNKQIQVYKPIIQAYPQNQQLYINSDSLGIIQKIHSKKIKLSMSNQYPTCVTLCQHFGIVLIGTSCGRIYEYLWPFNQQQDLQFVYTVHCSSSEIAKIQISTSFKKVYVYCKNYNILSMEIVQYIDGEQMPNIYVINPKSLYGQEQIKYEFSNRQLLYGGCTSYIYEELRKSNQEIQQLNFILEKNMDDIEEYINKANENHQKQIKQTISQKYIDVDSVKNQKVVAENKFKQQISSLNEQLQQNAKQHKQKMEKQKQNYEKKLLQIYKQANRLKGIYQKLQEQQNKQKSIHFLENDKVLNKFLQQNDKVQEEFKIKFQQIQAKNNLLQLIQKQQGRFLINQELQQYKNSVRQAAEDELKKQQSRKQLLLGSIGSFLKQISNLKQRRDQFESLVMETNLQIDELNSDKNQYKNKRQYLVDELLKKQKIILEKQKQMMKLIEGTSTMKKLKETHEYQLKQYEQEFEPILQKMSSIQVNVQKMNGQILKQYLTKTEREKQINSNSEQYKYLKRQIQKKIKKKQVSYTRLIRFLAQLQVLLEKPFDQNIKHNLICLSQGQNYEVNEQQVLEKIQNSKLLKKKQLIRKQIEQQQKREEIMIRNKNEIIRHHNENAVLVRQLNRLKLLQKQLLTQKHEAYIKLITAKSGQPSSLAPIETPAVKKSKSVLQLKKLSQLKFTPFQKHELQHMEMFNKGLTSDTKATRSGGQSMSLLKTLIKDIDTTDNRYEKMQIVRDRIRSFVNPQIRIRKNIISQVSNNNGNTSRRKAQSSTLIM